jgi:hypothetical protein
MGLLDFFKRKPESPAEEQALENLDEATRDVAWSAFGKEEDREHSRNIGPLTAFDLMRPPVKLHHVPGDPVPEPLDDPDPAGSGSLRETLDESDEHS